MTTRPPLTPAQKVVLAHLRDAIARQGYAPSLRDIARHLGHKGPGAVKKHLEALARKGYIRRTPRLPRAIEVLDQENRVPVVGTVRAGRPLLAVEAVEGYVALDPALFPGEGLFLLRITGNSMEGAHLLDGDYAVVRPQESADPGDIVVALVEEEATVKRLAVDDDGLLLKPEHPEMPPIRIAAQEPSFRILGKVIGVIRRIP